MCYPQLIHKFPRRSREALKVPTGESDGLEGVVGSLQIHKEAHRSMPAELQPNANHRTIFTRIKDLITAGQHEKAYQVFEDALTKQLDLPAYVNDPTDLIDLTELCARLKVQRQWAYEMRRVRRGNSDPLPAVNGGRSHLLFSWVEVCLWLRRRKHSEPRARRKRKKPGSVRRQAPPEALGA
jgi:hypothetical protein